MTLPDDNSREGLTRELQERITEWRRQNPNAPVAFLNADSRVSNGLPPIRYDRRVPPDKVYFMNGEILVGSIANLAPVPPVKRSWVTRLIALFWPPAREEG